MDSFERLMEQLTLERTRLEQLRADYATITSSRFHGLRMLWFSLKTVFKRESPADRYAVWSPGIGTGTGLASHVAVVGDAALDAEAKRLVERWARVSAVRRSVAPLVSVVIPLYNHRDVTVRCLQALVDAWPATLAVQVILVDDGSSEAMAPLVARMPGIDYIRNTSNEGFIRACNLGASLARGKYAFFLNNDTIVRNAAIDYLVSTAEADPSIGVVGSKLLLADGKLQTAGAIVWRDATGWEYGKFDDPADPRYNYVRDVDYVSGAALLVRTELFRALGGFGNGLQRAYYEDTDICFGARALGYRVVYQPLSEVVHYESVSSPNDETGMKRFQEINRPAFREKWAAELKRHYENSPLNVPAAARRLRGRPTILIVEKHVPLHDRDSGSRRLMHVIEIFNELGYHAIFLPENYARIQPYAQELEQLGVEVLYHVDGGRPLDAALDEVLPFVDVAWIARPDLYEKYAPRVRNGKIRLVYDTVDLHFVRKQREAELSGTGSDDWKEWQKMELAAARDAGATVVVTEDEKQVLEELGIPKVYVVPNVHAPDVTERRVPTGTSGLLFIGNYNHEPNIDACRWLVAEIMPLVWEKLPKVALTLAGANASESILELEAERVRIAGYVPDPAPYFMQSRVFVAPLRYGAGMKGKVGQALSYRLPVVTTPIGAEGFGFVDGEQLLVAPAQARAFADAIVRLYGDDALWQRLSDNSEAALAPYTPAAVLPRVRALVEDLVSVA